MGLTYGQKGLISHFPHHQQFILTTSDSALPTLSWIHPNNCSHGPLLNRTPVIFRLLNPVVRSPFLLTVDCSSLASSSPGSQDTQSPDGLPVLLVTPSQTPLLVAPCLPGLAELSAWTSSLFLSSFCITQGHGFKHHLCVDYSQRYNSCRTFCLECKVSISCSDTPYHYSTFQTC